MTNQKRVWSLALMLLILLSCRRETPPEIIGHVFSAVSASEKGITYQVLKHHPKIEYYDDQEVSFLISSKFHFMVNVQGTITCKWSWKTNAGKTYVTIIYHKGHYRISNIEICDDSECYVAEKEKLYVTDRAPIINVAEECLHYAKKLVHEIKHSKPLKEYSKEVEADD